MHLLDYFQYFTLPELYQLHQDGLFQELNQEIEKYIDAIVKHYQPNFEDIGCILQILPYPFWVDRYAEYLSPRDWKSLLYYHFDPIMLDKYGDYLNWEYLSSLPLPLHYMKKYQDKINWNIQRGNFSEKGNQQINELVFNEETEASNNSPFMIYTKYSVSLDEIPSVASRYGYKKMVSNEQLILQSLSNRVAPGSSIDIPPPISSNLDTEDSLPSDSEEELEAEYQASLIDKEKKELVIEEKLDFLAKPKLITFYNNESVEKLFCKYLKFMEIKTQIIFEMPYIIFQTESEKEAINDVVKILNQFMEEYMTIIHGSFKTTLTHSESIEEISESNSQLLYNGLDERIAGYADQLTNFRNVYMITEKIKDLFHYPPFVLATIQEFCQEIKPIMDMMVNYSGLEEAKMSTAEQIYYKFSAFVAKF